MEVHRSRKKEFNVVSNDGEHVVDTKEKQCDCGKVWHTDLPFLHEFAAFFYTRMGYFVACASFSNQHRYKTKYASDIRVPTLPDFSNPVEMRDLPILTRRASERLKK